MVKGSLSLALVALAAVVLAAQLKPAVAWDVDGRYTEAMQTEVRKIVQASIYDAPGLIRMLFHDCWVKGCDASVLLNIVPGQNEIHAVQNGGLRGMGVIQAIKDSLAKDYNYNDVSVSCADAIVFAAREATYILSKEKIKYEVDGPGRKDSSTSVASNAAALPGPFDNFATLVNTYKNNNFDVTDLVVLSGAHAIGLAHRPTFAPRLDKAVSAPPRSEINAEYQAKVDEKSRASPEQAVANNVRDMLGGAGAYSIGYRTNDLLGLFFSKPDTLDNSYYTANNQNMVLFNSDWVLRTNAAAQEEMRQYEQNPGLWYGRFGQAMAKLSKIGPDAGATFVKGGARTYCDRI